MLFWLDWFNEHFNFVWEVIFWTTDPSKPLFQHFSCQQLKPSLHYRKKNPFYTDCSYIHIMSITTVPIPSIRRFKCTSKLYRTSEILYILYTCILLGCVFCAASMIYFCSPCWMGTQLLGVIKKGNPQRCLQISTDQFTPLHKALPRTPLILS